ncbi:MAG: glycosyltransferase family 4 protein [Thermodesulfobacteriota bacterium]
MKLLIVDHSPFVGGATRVMSNLLELFDRKEFHSVMVCPPGSDSVAHFEDMGIEVNTVPMPWFTRRASIPKYLSYLFGLLLASYRITRLLYGKKIDIVHANSFIASLYCIIPALISRRPMVWHMHDILEADGFNRLFIRLSGFGARKIVCPSEAVKKGLVEFGVDPEKCVVIYNSMREVKDGVGRGGFREELNVDKETVLIGMVGFITEWKGQAVFVRTVPDVVKSFPRVKFVIVGDAMLDSDREYREGLHSFVEENGIGDRVIFTGHRKDVLDIMADLDIVVHASLSPDPLPTVVLEAMSAGRPVIATDVGGCAEMVTDGVNGFLIRPQDPKGLAECIVKLATDPDLRERMGREGSAILKEKFSPDENLRKIRQVYKEVSEG